MSPGGGPRPTSPTLSLEIRRARPEDAEALTRIAHAAKRYWQYPDDWILLWKGALTVTPEFVQRYPVYCATDGAELLGFYALTGAGALRELEHLWVVPERIGMGIGRRLLAHALETMRADGGRVLRIAADPNAERFYASLGARRVADLPSVPAGRTLPVLELALD